MLAEKRVDGGRGVCSEGYFAGEVADSDYVYAVSLDGQA